MDLTSFGTLFRFLSETEESLAALATRSATSDPSRASLFTDLASRHARRVRDLDRLRRERLNEVALEPISGMDPAAYALPSDLAAAEETAARLYDDSARAASTVLVGVDKALLKLARESRDLATRVRG